MKKYLIVLIIVTFALVGSSTFLGYKMKEYRDTLVASTTNCKTDNECTTLVLDRDGCSAIPMSTYDMQYFELTHTEWGGCDALVIEQPVAVCKENRCVFTKD